MQEFLTLKNYKEPLIPVKKGYGYLGAIQVTTDGSKIQCHIYGKLFENLTFHINSKHQMNSQEYKEKFQLAKQSALISEVFRDSLKQKTIEYMMTLSPEQKEALKNKQKEGYRKYLKERGSVNNFKIALETKNKRNACPQQLLKKIKEVAQKLKKTPTKSEFIVECKSQRYVHLIYKTYGSWSNALKLLNMTPANTSWKGTERTRQSDEALLEHLQNFWIENKRIPTETDSRRGLIPHSQLYQARFGGLVKARLLAGIHEKPEKRNTVYFSK